MFGGILREFWEILVKYHVLDIESVVSKGLYSINSTRITTTDQKLKFEVFSGNLFHFNVHDIYFNEPKEFF